MGMHHLLYVHGNERMGVHDVICDIFVAIARDVGFHIRQENLLLQSCATQRFVASDIAQAKEKNYHN
jgi:hypothetical protein